MPLRRGGRRLRHNARAWTTNDRLRAGATVIRAIAMLIWVLHGGGDPS